jgi:MATE family multidrug resistance protein
MGLVGCGWATLVVNWSMLGDCRVAAAQQAPSTASMAVGAHRAPDWQHFASSRGWAFPAGLSVLVEVTSFTLMALFIARLGTTASAAHQIASNLTAVAYMVPLSLSIATSARVSFWLGAGDAGGAARVCAAASS